MTSLIRNSARIRPCKALLTLTLLLPIQLYADNYGAPKFSDYPANMHSGDLVIPTFLKKDGDIWRDDMGKMVAPPVINTAGKYYMTAHSCGTSCRYYTLNDLSNGRESQALEQFSNGGGAPMKSKDGRNMVIDLISRPDSTLIIARYYIDRKNESTECRESYFALSSNGRSIRQVAESLRCTEDQ